MEVRKIFVQVATVAATFGLVLPAHAFSLQVPQVVDAVLQKYQTSGQVLGEIITGEQAPAMPPQNNILPGQMMPGQQQPNTLMPQNGMLPNQMMQPGMQPLPGVQFPAGDRTKLLQGATQMMNGLDKLGQQGTLMQQNGMPLPPNMMENMDTARQMIDKMKNALNPSDLQGMDVEKMKTLMNGLEGNRTQMQNQMMGRQNIQSGAKGMQSAITQFEKQVAKLTKQGITIPSDISDALAKAKAGVTALQSAGDDDAIEAAASDAQDAFQDLNDSRQELELLSRWKQTLAQVDRQLLQLKKQITKNQATAKKLATQGIDLSAEESALEELVTKLQAARDGAVASVAAGDAQEAFDNLQNDFFDHMSDVQEHQQIITSMAQLTRFSSTFKSSVTTMKRTITKAKNKKLDTTALEELLTQFTNKGNQILDEIKSADRDTDAIMTDLQDLEDLRSQFTDEQNDLLGTPTQLPWQGGAAQFKPLSVPTAVKDVAQNQAVPVATPDIGEVQQ
jgi:hypothetical protein